MTKGTDTEVETTVGVSPEGLRPAVAAMMRESHVPGLSMAVEAAGKQQAVRADQDG